MGLQPTFGRINKTDYAHTPESMADLLSARTPRHSRPTMRSVSGTTVAPVAL